MTVCSKCVFLPMLEGEKTVVSETPYGKGMLPPAVQDTLLETDSEPEAEEATFSSEENPSRVSAAARYADAAEFAAWRARRCTLKSTTEAVSLTGTQVAGLLCSFVLFMAVFVVFDVLSAFLPFFFDGGQDGESEWYTAVDTPRESFGGATVFSVFEDEEGFDDNLFDWYVEDDAHLAAAILERQQSASTWIHVGHGRWVKAEK